MYIITLHITLSNIYVYIFIYLHTYKYCVYKDVDLLLDVLPRDQSGHVSLEGLVPPAQQKPSLKGVAWIFYGLHRVLMASMVSCFSE